MIKNEERYIIGTFKPFMKIKEIFGYNTILKFKNKDYTINKIINILEEYNKNGGIQ